MYRWAPTLLGTFVFMKTLPEQSIGRSELFFSHLEISIDKKILLSKRFAVIEMAKEIYDFYCISVYLLISYLNTVNALRKLATLKVKKTFFDISC